MFSWCGMLTFGLVGLVLLGSDWWCLFSFLVVGFGCDLCFCGLVIDCLDLLGGWLCLVI